MEIVKTEQLKTSTHSRTSREQKDTIMKVMKFYIIFSALPSREVV